jgi:succinoglycan biosynthesis protein ExoO
MVIYEPAVSVIVPVFNAGAATANALRSLEQQGARSIEMIVIDDGSKDDSWGRLQRLARTDPRIRLERLPENNGPSAARNRGLELASGRWIAPLDADDRFLPNRLERLVACAETAGADMVADNLLLVDGVSGVERGLAWPPRHLSTLAWMDAKTFVEGNSIRGRLVSFGYMKPLLRRQFLQRHRLGYDRDLRLGEDFQMYLDCLLHGARWRLLPDALYCYALTPHSATRRITPEQIRSLLQRSEQLLLDGTSDRRPDLFPALQRRASELRLFLKHQEAIAALKRGHFAKVIRAALAEPGLWPRLAETIAEGTLKRVGIIPRHGARI